jgi:hypothetical protein
MAMTSDFFDTSNPHFLRAFFLFCDVCNKATFAASSVDVNEPRLRKIAVSMILSMRQQALIEQFKLFGGELKASYPSSWPKR